MKTQLLRIATFLAILTCGVMAQDVMIHEGPEMSVGVESLAGSKESERELVFRKQFFVDRVHLSELARSGAPYKKLDLSAIKAIEVATATVDLGQRKDFKVVRLELLKSTTPQPVDFYLIEMLVNGSAEHRIVLMDGSVLKPRLKKIGK
ncbi:MAG: hypothetical protein EOP87_21450 [Verrucomicrobiaceae bacterium]|nr:MAG: hypothetical protein EOP87_21450 [Verrucomicrobiaceae bacterium]